MLLAVFGLACVSLGAACQRSTTKLPANTETTNTVNTSTSPKEIQIAGKAFIKGYGTPSESYGMLATDGREISFGAYDAMREEFRSSIGDTLIVTFSSVCRTGSLSCCRTLFNYCGTVQTWTK